MREVVRVLKPGGRLLFLGRGVPDTFLPLKQLYALRAAYDLKTYGRTTTEVGAVYDLNFREELLDKYKEDFEVEVDQQKHLGLTRVLILRKK